MPEILGQSRALEVIRSTLRSGRVHHGWIFSGPRGVGKFTTAIELARLLLDPEADVDRDFASTSRGSNSRVQAMLDSGVHPDLHVIRKELAKFSDNPDLRGRKLMNIPLDLLRERMLGGKTSDDRMHEAPAYRTAALGHGKVFIIDEAELLDPNAQNSMLKTLEEPPAQTYFFLITSQPDRLLPTIRSRCQQVRFGALDDHSMKAWLKSTAGQRAELGANSPELLSWVERFAGGSPGLAQLAIEYGFHDWQKTLDPMLGDLERGKFPVAMGDTMAGLVDQFAVAWVKAHGEKNTSKDAANKDGARNMFSLLATHSRARVADAIEQGEDPSTWLNIIDLIRDAERELDANVNLKLLLENLVVQWARAVRLAPASARA